MFNQPTTNFINVTIRRLSVQFIFQCTLHVNYIIIEIGRQVFIGQVYNFSSQVN